MQAEMEVINRATEIEMISDICRDVIYIYIYNIEFLTFLCSKFYRQ